MIERTPEVDSVVKYEITVYVTRPVRYDLELPIAEQEDWAMSHDAKRELEREILRALRVLDGDCDCEVMTAEVVRQN